MATKRLLIHFGDFNPQNFTDFKNTLKTSFPSGDGLLKRMYDFEEGYLPIDDFQDIELEQQDKDGFYADYFPNTYLFKATSLLSDEETLAVFAKLPFIEYASFDESYGMESLDLGFGDRGIETETGAVFDENPQWNLENINITQAILSKMPSKEVLIAVIDSGIQEDHPDIQANIETNLSCYWDETSETFKQGTPADRKDEINHGTGVAGVIGAVFNKKGIVGIAPKSKIINIKVVNSHNRFNASTVFKGIALAIKKGAQVINVSWGYRDRASEPKAILRMAEAVIDLAHSKNIPIVFSAGNDDSDAKLSVPNWEKALVVGGLKRDNTKSDSSNWGEILNFSAPADDFLILTNDGRSDRKGSGTTLAAPHVTGLIGLMLSEGHLLTFEDIKKSIATGSLSIAEKKAHLLGSGIIDVSKTLVSLSNHNNSLINKKSVKMSQNVKNFFDLIKSNAVSYKKNKKKIDDIVTELVGDPGHCVKWCYVGTKLECCDAGQESFLMAIPATGSTVTILDAENRALPYQVLPVTEGFKDFKIIDSTQHKKAKKIVLVLHGKRKNITLDIPV